jgi:hypothetical protein
LERAERYRLLNEPEQAESICQDILAVAPDNEMARITMLLALTDQFPSQLSDAFPKAKIVGEALRREYDRAYYTGLIYERRAGAHFGQGAAGCGAIAHSWYEKALGTYEKAEALRRPGNDEAILRWNACVRVMNYHPSIEPEQLDATPQLLE